MVGPHPAVCSVNCRYLLLTSVLRNTHGKPDGGLFVIASYSQHVTFVARTSIVSDSIQFVTKSISQLYTTAFTIEHMLESLKYHTISPKRPATGSLLRGSTSFGNV